jgi:hypothetical protein
MKPAPAKRLAKPADPQVAAALKDLQTIPSIGPSLARDLYLLGYRQVADLRDADPQDMYQRLMDATASYQDPCVLYSFRCAVYFARTEAPETELLRWWNWKDRVL